MNTVATWSYGSVPLALVLAAIASGCGGSSDAPQPGCVPAAEICNGLDDDCDGAVDQGDPGGGAVCSTGLQGVCAAGVHHCQGGSIVCVQSTASAAEICNGLDDDCDGAVDQGDPGGGASCSTGLQGVCAAGVQHCQGGAVTCVQTTAARSELCNGLDDDCDALVDEDFDLVSDPQNCGACGKVCTFAHAVAQCASATCAIASCSPGFADVNATALDGCEYACPVMPPRTEVCNGLDDDCDGVVDDGDPGGGASCDTGLPGVCAAGVTSCTGGALQCTQTTQATAEVCSNGLDDDCDGVVDACPYAHTILIDGVNDFIAASEAFATTSPNYTAYVTWDADRLYVGFYGPEVGDPTAAPTRWLAVYLDVRVGTAGRSTGSTFNTQTVSFPAGFSADYEIATRLDDSEKVTRAVQAGSWVAFAPSPAVAVARAPSLSWIELSIPLVALGNPAAVGIITLVVRESLWSEYAYGGLYADGFTEGSYAGGNIPVVKYLLADLAATRAPNDPANKRP